MKYFKLTPQNSAFMMIDIQDRLAPAMMDLEKVLRNNEILITAFNELAVPMIYTEQYPKGLGGTLPQLSAGLAGAQRFEKTQFSALTDEVSEALEALGRKNIILTGMETHICVFQTARALLENGYQVFLVVDGVASRTRESLETAVCLMKAMGVTVVTTEMALFDMLGQAGTPEFKLVSKLIK